MSLGCLLKLLNRKLKGSVTEKRRRNIIKQKIGVGKKDGRSWLRNANVTQPKRFKVSVKPSLREGVVNELTVTDEKSDYGK